MSEANLGKASAGLEQPIYLTRHLGLGDQAQSGENSGELHCRQDFDLSFHTLGVEFCWKRQGEKVSRYFSDRESGPRPRQLETISKAAWGGIEILIEQRIDDGSFGYKFPDLCPDWSGVVCGCDRRAFWKAAAAEIAPFEHGCHDWQEEAPPTLAILDLIEFAADAVAKPESYQFHSFFMHEHLNFDREDGLAAFVHDVNRIFERNSIAFQLSAEGYIQRLAPEGLRESLAGALFQTSDDQLDYLLEEARRRYLSPDPKVRRDALEKLWDAFERLKTVEPGQDKKKRIATLLDRAARDTSFRQELDNEARALTNIGNNFHIRHSETTQEILKSAEQIDYLFHRLFSFVHFLLKMTGRVG